MGNLYTPGSSEAFLKSEFKKLLKDIKKVLIILTTSKLNV